MAIGDGQSGGRRPAGDSSVCGVWAVGGGRWAPDDAGLGAELVVERVDLVGECVELVGEVRGPLFRHRTDIVIDWRVRG